VVAPTSAGKTFISFYAMEQILREDDEGVLVYVAPTKALVNQIAAEIHGRFSKSYQKKGQSVWAIHTRDTRVHNPNKCQILVTVPHILQIVSPSSASIVIALSLQHHLDAPCAVECDHMGPKSEMHNLR
jgi:ATP-dependent RNA helicase DDX60